MNLEILFLTFNLKNFKSAFEILDVKSTTFRQYIPFPVIVKCHSFSDEILEYVK